MKLQLKTIFLITLISSMIIIGTVQYGVAAGAATHFSISAPDTVTTEVPFTITVTTLDASNSVATTYVGTIHFTSIDSQAILPADVSLTSGVGTFTVTLKTFGSQTLTATDTVSSTITGVSNQISVTIPAVHFYVNIISFNPTVNVGCPNTLVVAAKDASNNTVTSFSGKINFSSTDPKAVMPANSTDFDSVSGIKSFSIYFATTGTQTITITDSSESTRTTTSSPVSVATTKLSIVASPTSVNAGETVNFTVSAVDANGTPLSNYAATGWGGKVHFNSSDTQAVLPSDTSLSGGAGNFTATFQTGGSQTLSASDTFFTAVNGTSNAITVISSTTPTPATTPTPTSKPSPTQAPTILASPKESTTTTTGGIAANITLIIIAIIVVVVVAAVGLIVYKMMRRKSSSHTLPPPPPPPNAPEQSAP